MSILSQTPSDAKSFGSFGGGGRLGSLIVGIDGRSGKSGRAGIAGISGILGRVKLTHGARGRESLGISGRRIGLRLN